MIVIPFEIEHIDRIELQDSQEYLRPYLREISSVPGMAMTGIGRDGRIIGCAGLIEMAPWYAHAWSLLSDVGPREFISVHKAVLSFLNANPYDRLEAVVDCDFDAGHRWVKLLGFELEAPVVKNYSPGLRSVSMYARCR